MADISITGGISSLTNSYANAKSALSESDVNKFQSLLDSNQSSSEKDKNKSGETIASESKILDGRLNGDYTSGFSNSFTSKADKAAAPSGAAANSINNSLASSNKTIDKTSPLYEKSLELESYLVKMMLNSMRNTVSKTNLFGTDNSYAQNMYEDMLYDELATSMTKNAGFGIADQIYLELA